MFVRAHKWMVAGSLALIAVLHLVFAPLAHAGLHDDDADHQGADGPVCVEACVLCNAALPAIEAEHFASLAPLAMVLADKVPMRPAVRPGTCSLVMSGRAPPARPAQAR